MEQLATGVFGPVRVASPNNTPDELRKAMLAVAGHADDVDDCRELLMALGLIPQDFHQESTTRYGHGARRRVELTAEEKKAS